MYLYVYTYTHTYIYLYLSVWDVASTQGGFRFFPLELELQGLMVTGAAQHGSWESKFSERAVQGLLNILYVSTACLSTMCIF